MKFSKKVYKITKKIPIGRVCSYGEIARILNTKAYRAVGNALRNNEHPEIIPCFRVVKSNAEVGGYSGSDHKNIKKKIQKLKSEGVIIKNNKIVDFNKKFFRLS